MTEPNEVKSRSVLRRESIQRGEAMWTPCAEVQSLIKIQDEQIAHSNNVTIQCEKHHFEADYSSSPRDDRVWAKCTHCGVIIWAEEMIVILNQIESLRIAHA